MELPEPKTVESILKAGGVIAYIIAGLGVLAIFLLLIRGATLTYYAILARKVRGWVERQKSSGTGSSIAELESASGPHARVLTDVMKALRLPRQAQMMRSINRFSPNRPDWTASVLSFLFWLRLRL